MELHLIQRFGAAANAALIYALLCGNRAAMLAVRDPVELYDSGTLPEAILLDHGETAVVRSMVTDFKDS
jgi:hypothetical protein